MTGNWRPVHTARWYGSALLLKGLRLGLRPWGQLNGAPIIAEKGATAAAAQVGGPAARRRRGGGGLRHRGL